MASRTCSSTSGSISDSHPDVRRLERRAEATDRQYKQHFAGHPRLTRNPALMESMLEEIDGALSEAATLSPGSAGLPELVAELQRQRQLYVTETQEIRSAKSGGPEAWEAHRLTTWAALVGARYRRHFAGKNRLTRDLPLLDEIRSDSARIKGEIEAALQAGKVDAERVSSALQALEKDVALYVAEADRIREARDGALETEPDRLASALAAVANAQFALYKAHFAGQGRTSRRPALLERMIGALEAAATRMRSLQAGGLDSESNSGNIEIVAGRLRTWRTELSAVQQAKKETPLAELVTSLGAAANALFEGYRKEYAGQSRATRDLDPLTAICDGLYDIARQMDELDGLLGDPANRQNLGVVLENLRMYENEWDAIRKLRQQ